MSEQKSLRVREAGIPNSPVEYHPNGVPKTPVTWSQLFHECEMLRKALNEEHEKRVQAAGEGSYWKSRCFTLSRRLVRFAEHYEKMSGNFMEHDIRGPMMAQAAKDMRHILNDTEKDMGPLGDRGGCEHVWDEQSPWCLGCGMSRNEVEFRGEIGDA